MKFLVIIITTLISFSSFSYTEWKNYTPYHIFSNSSLIKSAQRKITILTKGSINSCSGFFEGNRFKAEMLSCKNGDIDLKIKFKNKVNCDQGMYITKKFTIKLSKDCFENFGSINDSIITINGKKFDSH